MVRICSMSSRYVPSVCYRAQDIVADGGVVVIAGNEVMTIAKFLPDRRVTRAVCSSQSSSMHTKYFVPSQLLDRPSFC